MQISTFENFEEKTFVCGVHRNYEGNDCNTGEFKLLIKRFDIYANDKSMFNLIFT